MIEFENGWVAEIVQQAIRPGLVSFEYHLWRSRRAHDNNDPPFLLNNHRAQIREGHQRVLRGPNGGLLHVDAGEVLIEDLPRFEQSSAFLRYQTDRRSLNEWEAGPRKIAPFLFSVLSGRRFEALDPQWLRERYTLSIEAQVEEAIRAYVLRAEAQGLSGDRRGTTLNLQVGASADDAYQITDDTVTVTDVSAETDSTTEHIGNRFQNVTIGQGATIDNAIFSIKISVATSDEPLHQVKAEAVDNAAQFTTGSNDIDARPRTIAAVNWNDTSVGTDGATFEQWGAATSGGAGTSIEAVIQEITDRAGWASGNALVLIYEQSSINGTRDLAQFFYDNNSADAAKLDIDFTGGAAPGGGVRHLALLGVGT